MSNFENENENENEINEEENNNNNNDNNNNNNNNNNENNSQNIDELVTEVKKKFDLSDADRNFLNKRVNQDEIEEKSLEILLKGKSKKLKAFYRWMEDEIGYKKNKKTKKWSKIKNNNENNNNSNKNNNNLNKNNNKKNNLQKNEQKNVKKNVSNDKKLQKVLKIYFGDKNEYKLSTYENLIKVSKKINNNNSDDVIQRYLKELIKNKEENKKNKNINSNNNKNMKLNSKNFVILEYENHNILKKVNENLKLSAYNINKIPEMCEKEGIIKYCKFLEKNIQNFKYIEILNNQQLKKCLIDNKKNSIILYLEDKKVFLYYHRKNIYILNYTNHNNNKVHEYLKKFIQDDKIKNIEEILSEVKNNSLSCICLDYVIFLSLINPKWKFASINKLIKDVSVEVSDFILYLCQKRVFS
jgi:hypothetical protein